MDASLMARRRELEDENSYYCISFKKTGCKIYLAGTFNDVAVFDADSLKQIGSIKLPGDKAITTAQIFMR